MSLASLHPQVVHFVIALLFAGVLLRCVSLTGRWAFTDHAAAAALLAGTVAAVLAVQSGTAAHGPVERIPGARAAVEDHQEWGETTRDVFLGVAVLEIAALALAHTTHARLRKIALAASAVAGLGGGYALYGTAERGGTLVYGYAGGVGTRSGDPADVGRLLVAGLYQQAMLDRAQESSADAAALIDQLARRYPEDTAVRLLAIESLIVDRKDGKGALAALDRFPPPPAGRFVRFRLGLLRADACVAAGLPDSAKRVLETMAREFGDNRTIAGRLAKLQ